VLNVPGETGLGYRSRVRYATTNNGESAMRKHGSNELVPIDECLIAESRLNEITTSNWRPSSEITLVAGSDEVLVLTDREIVPQISYSNRHGQWVVPAGDFWQVHKDAPEVLIDFVFTNCSKDRQGWLSNCS
jgi:tRNA/tmRNA/rRNA uracil-C5-methylase (TrmA/RlmC/RlmD family)